jgi:hypothetical protein
MTDADPCRGCRHLITHPWPQRPGCRRDAYYGTPACRYQPGDPQPQPKSGAPGTAGILPATGSPRVSRGVGNHRGNR